MSKKNPEYRQDSTNTGILSENTNRYRNISEFIKRKSIINHKGIIFYFVFCVLKFYQNLDATFNQQKKCFL